MCAYKKQSVTKTPAHDAIYFWLTEFIKQITQIKINGNYGDENKVSSVEWKGEPALVPEKYGKTLYPDALIESAYLSREDHKWLPERYSDSFGWICERCRKRTGERKFEDDLPAELKHSPPLGEAYLKWAKIKNELREDWHKYVSELPIQDNARCLFYQPIRVIVEIKPQILSFGETLRQLNTYLERLGKGSWEPLLITTDCRFDKQWMQNWITVLHPIKSGAILVEPNGDDIPIMDVYFFKGKDCVLLEETDEARLECLEQANQLSLSINQHKTQLELLNP